MIPGTALQRIGFCLTGFLIVIFVSACGNHATNRAAAQRISLVRAEELVRTTIYEEASDMNPAAQFPLEEITTDEIWERLDIQIFKVVGDWASLGDTHLIKDEKVEILYGVTSMQVIEFGENGESEFVYAFYGGSGLHYSQLAMYCSECPDDHIITSNLVYLYGDMILAHQQSAAKN